MQRNKYALIINDIVEATAEIDESLLHFYQGKYDAVIQVEEDVTGHRYANGVILPPPTDEELAAAKQSAKPLNLKQAENFYLSVIASIPETVGIALSDTTEIIAYKLEAAIGIISELEAVKIGLKLQAAVSEMERQGGSWYDLPPTLHVIEV